MLHLSCQSPLSKTKLAKKGFHDRSGQHRLRQLTVSQVKVVRGASRPQPHGVHGVVHVAGDGCVVGHCQNHLNQRERRTVSQQENKTTVYKKFTTRIQMIESARRTKYMS